MSDRDDEYEEEKRADSRAWADAEPRRFGWEPPDYSDPNIAEFHRMAAIQETATTDWRAAAWLLERRFPERWGKQASEIRQLQRRAAALENVAPT